MKRIVLDDNELSALVHFTQGRRDHDGNQLVVSCGFGPAGVWLLVRDNQYSWAMDLLEQMRAVRV